MLAGAGFGDHALDAEPLCEQRLPDRVVYLVRAGMREILSLEPDVRAPAFAEPWRMRQRGRPAYPLAQLTLELGLELRIVQVLPDARLETFERGYQRFGNVAAAEGPETAPLVGQPAFDRGPEQRFCFARLE